MPDEVQKSFVRSFVGYLKKEVSSQTLTPDQQESVEVAMQCLQAAFDVVEDGPEGEQQTDGATEGSSPPNSGVNVKDIDLFELFQSLYIERNPESLQLADTIKNEGNRLMKDGKYNEALLQYNRAITFDPKNPIYYCNRAAAYIRLGDNEHAVTDCKSALLYNPSYGKAYGRLGIAYSNLGKYEEAIQAYTKAIELEPDNQDYRNNIEIARNARSQPPNMVTAIPQLTEGINAMLSNPAIRNIFSTADLDLEQLQAMSQNPVIMNAIGQMFAGLQSGGGPGMPGAAPGGGAGQGGIPAMPNELMQLFQSFASQLAGSTPGDNNQGGAPGNQPNNEQQPPPSSS